MPDMDLRILISARDATRGVLGGLSSALGGISPIAIGAGVAIAGVGLALGYSVKQAADFQQGINRLKTGAGDATDNLTTLGQGILKVSTDTGVLANGTDGLNAAMYQIISNGQRGAQALDTLNVAAKGSIIEQAQVVDVARAVAGAMKDYGTGTYSATQYMNGYIYAVAHGTITLEQLAVTMGPILPYAKNLGISFADVAGAMSTMTNAMIPAARAATSLRFLFQSLENPTAKASKAMKEFGVNSVALGDELRVSLPGALQMVYDAARKAGPEGSVPFNRAISDMIGGMRSMQAYLSLTGSHFKEFMLQSQDVAAAMNAGAKEVNGWNIAQSNMNVQLDRAHAALDAMAIQLGTDLLPILTPIVKNFADLASGIGNIHISQEWKDAGSNIGSAANQLGIFLQNMKNIISANVTVAGHTLNPLQIALEAIGAAFSVAGSLTSGGLTLINAMLDRMQNKTLTVTEALAGMGVFGQKTGITTAEAMRLVADGIHSVYDETRHATVNLDLLAKGAEWVLNGVTNMSSALKLLGDGAGHVLTVDDAAKLLAMGIKDVNDSLLGTIDLQKMLDKAKALPKVDATSIKAAQNQAELTRNRLMQLNDPVNPVVRTASVIAAEKETQRAINKLIELNGPYDPNVDDKKIVNAGNTADSTYKKLLNLNRNFDPSVDESSVMATAADAVLAYQRLQKLNGTSVWNSYINTVSSGGPVHGRGFASGTPNYPGGVGLVGERGPELVSLPRGSRIFNNSQTQGMLRSGSGGGPNINININTMAGSRAEVQRMVDLLEAELGSRFRGQTPNFGFGGIL